MTWVKSPRPFDTRPLVKDDPRLKLDHLREHRDFFRYHCLKIRTKTQGLQPLKLNYTQRYIVREIERLRCAGLPPRIIILKSRQVGSSTINTALLFEDCFLNPFRSGLVIADTTDHAKGLFRMVRRFNRFLPDEIRMKERLNNVGEVEFPNDSRIQVETAGDVHSMTADGVLFSEFAYMEEAKQTLDEALQAMPSHQNTLAVIESTANGEGNLFHDLWVRAVGKQRDPSVSPWEQGWVPVFVPWWRHEEYQRKPWFDARRLDSTERDLTREFNCSLAQLAWRRWCIEHNCGGDVETFLEKYPATWEEAFKRSGRPVFQKEHLAHYQKEIPPYPKPGTSLWEQAPPSEPEWDSVKRVSIIVPQEKGGLRIFVPRNPRHTYILGADPSEGDPKSDPSPIEVLDQMTLQQVAEWWGRCEPDVLARRSAHIGLYYNEALINAEANNHGIYYFATLLEMGYPNIYFRQTSEDTVAGEVTDKPGIFETNKTKHAIVDRLRRYVREHKGGIYSPILYGELSSAVYERKEGFTVTRITKPSGKFIDTVIAFGIALYTHSNSIEEPLTPLPEVELMAAAHRVAQIRERDPEGAELYALDLTGMSAADLDVVFEQRHQRRIREARTGHGRFR